MKQPLKMSDVKAAIWDKKFRDLFPEYKDAFEKYLKDPGCACNLGIVKDLMRKKDRIQKYFPTKECLTPEQEDNALKNEWGVINCPIQELENRLKKLPKGKRIIAASRFKDRITAIVNDVNVHFHVNSQTIEEHVKDAKEATMNWKIINTNTAELLTELNKLPQGRKQLTLTRFQDKITLIVNDMGVLF